MLSRAISCFLPGYWSWSPIHHHREILFSPPISDHLSPLEKSLPLDCHYLPNEFVISHERLRRSRFWDGRRADALRPSTSVVRGSQLWQSHLVLPSSSRGTSTSYHRPHPNHLLGSRPGLAFPGGASSSLVVPYHLGLVQAFFIFSGVLGIFSLVGPLSRDRLRRSTF